MTGKASPKTKNRPKRSDKGTTVADSAMAKRTDNVTEDGQDIVRDGFTLDFISGTKEVKETPKELVRQRIARALFHEYGISVEDMAADFPVLVGGRRRRVDIAIFATGESHAPENIQRVVVCRPEPKQNKRGAVKMRDYEQAEQDIADVKPFFEEITTCKYALWTNGLEFFFLQKRATKFEVVAEPIGDWPPVDETIADRNVLSRARARRADPEMLRTAFRRCHNFIHGNEGMPKDAAFWQFLYLIFCKMYDERRRRDARRFWAGPKEQFTAAGRKAIRRRIDPLFGEVKQEYKAIFSGGERIDLSDRALAFMISELSKYEFSRIDVDAKGAAYQEIVGTNLRGDRGQYFTPARRYPARGRDPRPEGGRTAARPGVRHRRLSGGGTRPSHGPIARGGADQRRDGDHRGVRVAEQALAALCLEAGVRLRLRPVPDSCEPDEHGDGRRRQGSPLPPQLAGVPEGPPGRRQVGAQSGPARVGRRGDDQPTIRIRHPDHRREHPPALRACARLGALGRRWLSEYRAASGQRRARGPVHRALPRLAQARWTHGHRPARRHPGQPGRGVHPLVDPAPRLGARQRGPAGRDLHRRGQRQHPHQPAVSEEEAGRSRESRGHRRRADYPIFMAVAEKVGFDRRGNTLYKRSAEGDEITRDVEEIEIITVGGRKVARTLRRRDRIPDNDLPEIAKRYRAFRQEHPEPEA